MPLRTGGPPLPAGRSSCRWTGASTRRRAARSWRSSAASRRRCSPISIDEAFLDVTGVAGAVRRRRGDRAVDQAGRPRRGRADDLGGRGRDEAGRQGRVGPAQARRAGGRAARRGGGVPGAAADLAAVGRGREDGGGPARVRGPDDRRPGGPAARCARAAVRQARGVAGGAGARDRPRPGGGRRAGEVDRPRAHLRPRHRRSRRSSSGRSWAWPTAWPGACARRGSGP